MTSCADGEVREDALLVVVGRLVLARLVGREEAAERDHRARGAELDVLARRARRADPQRDGLTARVLHLRGERPLPDEVVERELVAAELALRAPSASGTCRRPAGSPRAPPGRSRPLARSGAASSGTKSSPKSSRDLRARGCERGLGERRRVGAHVRDVARLVEPLGDAHRRLRREAELAARLLLQRRGAERRRRLASVRPLVDRADGERRVLRGAPRALARASSSRRTTPLVAELARSARSPCPARRARRRPRRAVPRTRRDRTSRGGPSTRPTERHPLALALRRRVASRPTARGRPRVRASPSSRGRARPRSRRGGRGSGASPARRRGARRCSASPRAPARSRPS